MISREQAGKYYPAARLPAMEQSPADDGHLIGRDPRKLTQEVLRALGHEPTSPLAVLRVRCLDCCAGSADEVRKCTAVNARAGRSEWVSIRGAPPPRGGRKQDGG